MTTKLHHYRSPGNSQRDFARDHLIRNDGKPRAAGFAGSKVIFAAVTTELMHPSKDCNCKTFEIRCCNPLPRNPLGTGHAWTDVDSGH